MDEVLQRRAKKNVEGFESLIKDLKKIAVMNGKDPNKFLEELGKLKLDELSPEKMDEILNSI